MRTKKITALILCAAMLVTSAVPAAAAGAERKPAAAAVNTSAESEMTAADTTLAKASATATAGWVRVGKEYKWRLSNGKILTKPGWYTLGRRRYYLLKGGVRKTGLLTYKGKIYYLSGSSDKVKRGAVVTGLRDIKIGSKTYKFYFDPAAKGAAAINTWKTIGKDRYYFGSNGRAYTGWKTIGKKCYAFSRNGKVKRGVVTISGRLYLFDTKTGAAIKGKCVIGGKTYYGIDSKGRALVNKYAYKVGSRYYRVNSKGVMTRLKKQVEILAGIRLDKCKGNLKKAFNWSASLRYRSSVPGAKTAENYGIYGFKYGSGDCYVMACTFYWMAKAKGMDAHFVKGTFKKTNGKGNHGWVEIDERGKTYVYDPNFTSQFKLNGYRITYGAKNTLKYLTHKRQN